MQWRCGSQALSSIAEPEPIFWVDREELFWWAKKKFKKYLNHLEDCITEVEFLQQALVIQVQT